MMSDKNETGCGVPPEEQMRMLMRDTRETRKIAERVESLLTGNGHPERGIIIRMDRLEQAESRRSKVMGAAVIAAITAVITAIATAIFK